MLYVFCVYAIVKEPDAGKDWGQEKKSAKEDEMVGRHHWLNGHEFEQTLGEDREDWHAVVHGDAKSQTGLHDWTTIVNSNNKN